MKGELRRQSKCVTAFVEIVPESHLRLFKLENRKHKHVSYYNTFIKAWYKMYHTTWYLNFIFPLYYSAYCQMWNQVASCADSVSALRNYNRKYYCQTRPDCLAQYHRHSSSAPVSFLSLPQKVVWRHASLTSFPNWGMSCDMRAGHASQGQTLI